MKTKFFFSTIFILVAITSWTQSPNLFNYQAQALDANGAVLKNHTVKIRISILENSVNGTTAYQEEHQVTTSDVGIFTLQIGNGTVSTGQFANLQWNVNTYWLRVEGDFNSQGYALLGSSQMVSVPYAMHAQTAAQVDDADADPSNEIQTLTKVGNSISLSGNGGEVIDAVDDADADTTNELQTLSVNGNVLTISDGNSVNLPSGGSSGGGDEDPNNEIQSLTHTKTGNEVKLDISLGGTGTTINVEDTDADPQNEIQNLSIKGKQLSLSNANQVDLTSIATPWEPNSDGIQYKQGNVYILKEEKPDTEIRITHEEITGADGNASFAFSPINLTFHKEGTGKSSGIDNSSLEILESNGSKKTGVYTDSVVVENNKCKTDIFPGKINLKNDTELSHTSYSKDSLYYFYAAGNLAFPDVSTFQATHLNFKTIGLGLTSRMGPGGESFEDDNCVSEQTSNQLRIYNKGNQPFDRAIFSKDSLSMWNEARWKNVDIKTSTGKGGSIDLFGAAGSPLVQIGANKSSFFSSLPPTGNLFLHDHLGKIRLEARVDDQGGIMTLQDDTTLTFISPAGISSGPGISSGDFSIIEIKTILAYNDQKDAGYLELSAGENIHKIAFLGSDLLDPENGRLCLYNKNQEFEKVCAVANDFNGGELFLEGLNSPNVYAGGFFDRGIVYVSDSVGFERAGMRVDHQDLGEFYLNGGQVTVNNTFLDKEATLDKQTLNFFGPTQDVASCLGKEIGMENTGLLSLFGQNTNLNVFAGHDNQAGEIPDGNVGLIQVHDEEGQARAWMNGYGTMVGSTLKLQDFNANKLIEGGFNGIVNATTLDIYGSNGNVNASFSATNNGTHGWFGIADQNGGYRAGMFIDAQDNNNGKIFADIKHFRMENPSNPNQEIWYASLEGPEAGAYVRGTAKLSQGEAFVPFPEHFQEVCNSKTITIQLTPRHWDTYGLALVKITTEGFYVKELKGGDGSFEFDWEAKGVRNGHEDYKAVMTKEEVNAYLKNVKSIK